MGLLHIQAIRNQCPITASRIDQKHLESTHDIGSGVVDLGEVAAPFFLMHHDHVFTMSWIMLIMRLSTIETIVIET